MGLIYTVVGMALLVVSSCYFASEKYDAATLYLVAAVAILDNVK